MNTHLEFLKRVKFLRHLPDSEVARIDSMCEERCFAPGEVVFREGSPGNHFYIILEGAVEIWKNFDTREQDLLTIFEPGQSFGELALIDDFPRSATVVCRESSRLLTIDRGAFQKILQQSASVSFSIMKSLSYMIRERTETYLENLRERNRHLEQAYEKLKREIEDRRIAERQLEHQAYHDGLTGLPNRALFLNRLDNAMEKALRFKDFSYAVLYLDIDRFSVINETFGHDAGDDVLIQVGHRLQGCLRRTETLARFSGDEFAVLIDGIQSPLEVQLVAKRIHKELNDAFMIRGKEVFITASIGIVLGTTDYHSTVDVLRDADIAMYGAKARGFSEYQIYDAGLHEKTMDLLRLETDLRGAVARHEFQLKYQPIVNLKTCEIVGMEALVRWLHPERGVISPEVFIPIAERIGSVLPPLGSWILEEACRTMKGWLDLNPIQRDLFINVNISGKQFMQPDFLDRFRSIVQRSGLPPTHLKIELTESVLIENVEYLAGMLEEIKSLGVQIAIDDFGTGYSSLSYLTKFPIDVLKIDRSFITQMNAHNPKDLVPIIISIAHKMSMTVVGEGVENVYQLNRLKTYGCEFGQGFLFSKPLSEKEVLHFLKNPDNEICRFSEFVDLD